MSHKNQISFARWIGGYDGGDEAVIWISTAFADYHLTQPSPLYLPYLNAVLEKSHLAKLTVDFLCLHPDADYPDLLNHIRVVAPPKGMRPLTEDAVIRHAQFIVSQVESLDEDADEDDVKLVTSPSMRAFIKLTGASLGAGKTLGSWSKCHHLIMASHLFLFFRSN
jgi:DNA (cytosine-5)-methyltransferase 1